MNYFIVIVILLFTSALPDKASADWLDWVPFAGSSVDNGRKEVPHSSGGTIARDRIGYLKGTYRAAESKASVFLAAPAVKFGANQLGKRATTGVAVGAAALSAPAWAPLVIGATTIAGLGMVAYETYSFVAE